VLSVKELLKIAASMQREEFVRQLGPYVLVQRPPDLLTQQRALQLGAKRTVALRSGESADDEVSLLFEFDDLLISTLPPMAMDGTLLVGRLPDCDLVVDDSSVSKHHARLAWDAQRRSAVLEDLGSSNGTHINGEQLHIKMPVRDGDTVTFGEARYCFLLSETLHAKLTTGRFRSS
jgi:FHA domain